MSLIKFLEKGPGFILLMLTLAVIFFIVLLFVRRSEKKPFIISIMIPVFFIELAVLFSILLLAFPETDAEVGAGVVPSIWIISIFTLSIFLLIRGVTGREGKDPEWGRISAVGVMIVLIIIYLLMIQFIGYTISTILFLVLSMLYLRYKNWKTIIILTTGWILFSYFVFYRLLYVPFPKGLLIEWIF